MIHISNHRGYRDFYDYSAETEADSEEVQDAEGVQKMRDLYRRGNYRSVAEMISKEQCFSAAGIPFRRYRNRAGREERFIMPREETEAEARSILLSQQRFYPAITDDFIEKILGILFAQRDFEDGPGTPKTGSAPTRALTARKGTAPSTPMKSAGTALTALPMNTRSSIPCRNSAGSTKKRAKPLSLRRSRRNCSATRCSGRPFGKRGKKHRQKTPHRRRQSGKRKKGTARARR